MPDPMAFSDLDQLYSQILSVYPSAVNIVHFLEIITVSHGELAVVMEDIFGMEEVYWIGLTSYDLQSDELSGYVDLHFYDYLRAATTSPTTTLP